MGAPGVHVLRPSLHFGLSCLYLVQCLAGNCSAPNADRYRAAGGAKLDLVPALMARSFGKAVSACGGAVGDVMGWTLAWGHHRRSNSPASSHRHYRESAPYDDSVTYK